MSVQLRAIMRIAQATPPEPKSTVTARLRLAYIGTGFSDYDVGWYDNGDWNNYTRTVPTGPILTSVFRAANGTTGKRERSLVPG